MLGGLGSWVTTGLLGSMGALAPRGAGPQERSTTRLWRPDGSMGTGIVNGRTGAAWGVCGDVGGSGHEVRVYSSTDAMFLKRL
jgi:hypothetical protein